MSSNQQDDMVDLFPVFCSSHEILMLMDPPCPASPCSYLAGRNTGDMMAAPTTITDKEVWEYYDKQEGGEARGAVC